MSLWSSCNCCKRLAGGGVILIFACLSRMTIDHASLVRRGGINKVSFQALHGEGAQVYHFIFNFRIYCPSMYVKNNNVLTEVGGVYYCRTKTHNLRCCSVAGKLKHIPCFCFPFTQTCLYIFHFLISCTNFGKAFYINVAVVRIVHIRLWKTGSDNWCGLKERKGGEGGKTRGER